ncbi:MAG: hypothetical protein PHP08_04665 [Candidatus Dojkabacteria bacterium]|nr:hypothetical protein [Candidatus Dojkabacteria bacterium]
MPEVGGDALGYFDPYNIKSIEDSVRKVLIDHNLRDGLVKKGGERRKKFSWEKASKESLGIY